MIRNTVQHGQMCHPKGSRLVLSLSGSRKGNNHAKGSGWLPTSRQTIRSAHRVRYGLSAYKIGLFRNGIPQLSQRTTEPIVCHALHAINQILQLQGITWIALPQSAIRIQWALIAGRKLNSTGADAIAVPGLGSKQDRDTPCE
jgi:hypothetical protein